MKRIRIEIEDKIEYLGSILGKFLEGASELISDDELKDYLELQYDEKIVKEETE